MFYAEPKSSTRQSIPGSVRYFKGYLSVRYDPCQQIKSGPKRFCVLFWSQKIVFNEKVLLDVMYIDTNPILNVVDEARKFSADKFLPGLRTKQVWDTFVECWCLIYTGVPNRILGDQGTFLVNFLSNSDTYATLKYPKE